MKNYNQTAFNISIAIALLAVLASVGGLLITDLYNDNDFVKEAWFVNDFITLIVAVPLLITALWFVKKGSLRWRLVWMGMLAYMAYNFAFYLFGAAFNVFFLVYVALFSLSGVGLIIGLSNLDIEQIAQRFTKPSPFRWVSIYLLVMGIMLFLAEMSMVIDYLVSGNIPETIENTDHPTGIVFALDLSIVVPLFLAAAILLWKQRPWGYVLSAIMLLKGFAYGLVLCIGTARLAYSETYGKWDPLMPLYVVLTLGGFLGLWVLLRNFKTEE